MFFILLSDRNHSSTFRCCKVFLSSYLQNRIGDGEFESGPLEFVVQRFRGRFSVWRKEDPAKGAQIQVKPDSDRLRIIPGMHVHSLPAQLFDENNGKEYLVYCSKRTFNPTRTRHGLNEWLLVLANKGRTVYNNKAFFVAKKRKKIMRW